MQNSVLTGTLKHGRIFKPEGEFFGIECFAFINLLFSDYVWPGVVRGCLHKTRTNSDLHGLVTV